MLTKERHPNWYYCKACGEGNLIPTDPRDRNRIIKFACKECDTFCPMVPWRVAIGLWDELD